MTVVCSGVAQALVLLGWSGYHGLDRSGSISYRGDETAVPAPTAPACELMRLDARSAVVEQEGGSRELAAEQSGKTGHETDPRRGLGVVEAETERSASRDRSLVSRTTKKESSQFRSRPNTSVKHHLLVGGARVRTQKPTG